MSGRQMNSILITGVSRGIGNAVLARLLSARCPECLRKGYEIFGTVRKVDSGEAMELSKSFESLEGSGNRFGGLLEVDLSNPASVEALVAEINRRTLRIHLLVNNAAIFVDGWNEPLFRQTLQVNCLSPVSLVHELLALSDYGLSRDSIVVNVSSGYGRLKRVSNSFSDRIIGLSTLDELISSANSLFEVGDLNDEYMPCYKLSKALLNRATQMIAADGTYPSCNAVCPGWVRTRMGGPTATRSVDGGADSVLATIENSIVRGDSGKFQRDGKDIEW